MHESTHELFHFSRRFSTTAGQAADLVAQKSARTRKGSSRCLIRAIIAELFALAGRDSPGRRRGGAVFGAARFFWRFFIAGAGVSGRGWRRGLIGGPQGSWAEEKDRRQKERHVPLCERRRPHGKII